MSYSFSITAGSKSEAAKKVEEQLAAVVQGQPSHAADRRAAQNAAEPSSTLSPIPARTSR